MGQNTEQRNDSEVEPEAADVESSEEPGAEASAAGEETPEETIERLTRENEELREKWLRAQADYKNLRRRGQADYEAGLQRQQRPLLEELLLVLDFLELALASPTTTPEAKNLHTGVEMTHAKFLQALESVDVHRIPAEGPFDPDVHEATGTRATDEVPPGHVVETVRRGYTWGGGVLRPAHVIVAADADDAQTTD